MNDRPYRQPPKPDVEKPQGILARIVSVIAGLLGALLVAVAVSVVIEMMGIALGWWGSDHAASLLFTERGYIEAIERLPLLALSPVMIAATAESRFDGVTRDVRRSAEQARGSDPLSVYFLGALNTMKLVLFRLVVCVFSLPGYAVVALGAVIDGLVQRDIRKFTGGHESSYVFHKAKRWVLPGILLTLSVYLMLPVSLYPALVFAPSMALFGFMLFIAASRFKKFL